MTTPSDLAPSDLDRLAKTVVLFAFQKQNTITRAMGASQLRRKTPPHLDGSTERSPNV